MNLHRRKAFFGRRDQSPRNPIAAVAFIDHEMVNGSTCAGFSTNQSTNYLPLIFRNKQNGVPLTKLGEKGAITPEVVKRIVAAAA